MIIWSAVVAGCGIIALLGRHAAINRFGTDDFTGNILFAVFFILLVGLYFSIQPVFEAIFKRLFAQRTPALMVAEMSNGEHIAVPVNDESLELMQCEPLTHAVEGDVYVEDVEFAEEVDHNEFEVVEIYENIKLIRFPDGFEVGCSVENTKKEILEYKAYHDATAELEEEYLEWQFENALAEYEKNALTEQEKYDLEHNIKRVKVKSKIYNDNCGTFTSTRTNDYPST